jgi:UDPglucose 6-dehydrogenase
VLSRLHTRPIYIDTDPAVIALLHEAGHIATSIFQPNTDDIMVFMCLPTPAKANAGYDLSIIEEATRDVVRICSEVRINRLTIVVRSTVPPGTCNNVIMPAVIQAKTESYDVAVVAFPEFLREAHAVHDALNPRMIVMGSKTGSAVEQLVDIFAKTPCNTTLFDDPTSAEMVKVAHNAFNASKISFWNEMHRIGSIYNLDMNLISETVALTAEASWNPHYGIRGGRPFSGSCLPKDILGLMAHARSIGLTPHLLHAVNAINDDFDRGDFQ